MQKNAEMQGFARSGGEGFPYPSTLQCTLQWHLKGFRRSLSTLHTLHFPLGSEGLKGKERGFEGKLMQSFAHSLDKGECAMKRTLAFNDRGCRVGETHHRAKLTDSDIDQILELRDLGLSYREIALKFDDIPGGISKSTVRDIIKCRIRAQTPASFKVRIAD